MNYRTKNKVIAGICNGGVLFIKDTGIKVLVSYFGTDNNEFRKSDRDGKQYCNIELVGTPTSKVLKLFRQYHIKRNSSSGVMELEGVIDLTHLSITPYESKAGKLLYEKKNK
jgi:hypothetical protein